MQCVNIAQRSVRSAVEKGGTDAVNIFMFSITYSMIHWLVHPCKVVQAITWNKTDLFSHILAIHANMDTDMVLTHARKSVFLHNCEISKVVSRPLSIKCFAGMFIFSQTSTARDIPVCDQMATTTVKTSLKA